MRFRKGSAGLVAGFGAAIAIAAFAPGTALAHPCAGAGSEASSFLSLNTATWVGIGSYPTHLAEHECSGDQTVVAQYENIQKAGDPVEDAVSTFEYSPNLKPIGYSARVVPPAGATFPTSAINSDLAFQGKYAYQGTYAGFRIIDIENPADPKQILNYTGCSVGQGDVVVHGNILVRSWDSPNHTNASCGGTLVGAGFEGIHIFDISDPANPVMIDTDPNVDGAQGLRFSTADNPDTGCGSHTATAVPHEASNTLYIYNGGSSGSCTWMDVVKIPLANPGSASVVNRAMALRQCHDNTVLLNGANSYASCAGGNGISMFKFDTTIDPTAEGGIEKPTRLWSKRMPNDTVPNNQAVSIGHSAAFSYDGKTVVFGWEPGGGTSPQCQTTTAALNKTLFFMNTETGETVGTLLHPRHQTNLENCTWHNFNTVPTKGGNYLVSGNYQAGIIVVDYTNPAAPQAIAQADPTPLPKATNNNGNLFDPDGGDWSTYWYNGKIYESDIYRGMMVWELDNTYTDRANTVAMSNPQTQIGLINQDNAKPTISIAAPLAGGQFLQNSQQIADFSCADEGLGVESCVGTVADGANVNTSTIGYHTFKVTATDAAGNVTEQEVQYVVNSTAVEAAPGAQVPATLAMTLGTAPSFGAFTPGVARTYNASTTANVISTAGDATLSVSDPSSSNTGKLENGAFTLAQPMMTSATSAGGTGSAAAAVGGSAAPTNVLAYSGPISNDSVTLNFSQAIGANEALRTGTYSKELTFTLSTTQP
jgi:hypothetical protein